MPGEAGEGERRAAARHRELRDLGEAARDERGARVVAEAHAVDRAGRDGDDVLERAAALDARRRRRSRRCAGRACGTRA